MKPEPTFYVQGGRVINTQPYEYSVTKTKALHAANAAVAMDEVLSVKNNNTNPKLSLFSNLKPNLNIQQ